MTSLSPFPFSVIYQTYIHKLWDSKGQRQKVRLTDGIEKSKRKRTQINFAQFMFKYYNLFYFGQKSHIMHDY